MANGRKKHKLFKHQGKSNRPPELFIRKDYEPQKLPVPHSAMAKEESLRRMAIARYRSDPEKFLRKINRD